MKRILILLAVAASVCAVSCKKQPKAPATPAIVGEWQLSGIESKAVEYAGKEIDVYLSFASDGSFELYQNLAGGRFIRYTGSWELDGSSLSGTYSNKKAWGSTYTVNVSGDSMTLTSDVSGEVDTYTRKEIPSEVKEGSYEN